MHNKIEGFSITGVAKPPLGLRPRIVVDQLRIEEILEAYDRYKSADYVIPREWSEEYSELMRRLDSSETLD